MTRAAWAKPSRDRSWGVLEVPRVRLPRDLPHRGWGAACPGVEGGEPESGLSLTPGTYQVPKFRCNSPHCGIQVSVLHCNLSATTLPYNWFAARLSGTW